MARKTSILRHLPDFFASRQPDDLLTRLVAVLGEALDGAEADLLNVMRAHWVDTAGNRGSRGLGTTQKGDLDKIFSLYLENLGGTSLLSQRGREQRDTALLGRQVEALIGDLRTRAPSAVGLIALLAAHLEIEPTDAEALVNGGDGAGMVLEKISPGLLNDFFYRRRIRGLLDVLARGAATPAGLVEVVAANLGIVGASKAATAARKRIRVVEFLPQPMELSWVAKPFDRKTFDNPNPVAVTPEIRLRFALDLPVSLLRPSIVNLETKSRWTYLGTVQAGEELVLLADGRAWLKGIEVKTDGAPPVLPPGESTWQLEADVGLAEGAFDQTLFDLSLFEQHRLEPADKLDRPAFELQMTFPELKPGAFMVRIPWDIPGFTDNFAELDGHPRQQIPHIVNQVKAAGTSAVIAYDKTFQEHHDMAAALVVERSFDEDAEMVEANFEIGSRQRPYPGGREHQMEDKLITTGVFDRTRFDSLNTFA